MEGHAFGQAHDPGADIELSGEPDVTDALTTKRNNLLKKLEELDTIITRVNEEYSLKLQELQAQKKPLEEALYHVDALLRLDGHNFNRRTSIEESNALQVTTGGISIIDATVRLLEDIHQPTHYRDIASKLQERSVYIPGKDPAATLLSRISRDNRFKRANKRGVYALSTWRVRRSKTRKKSKKSHT